MHCLLLSHFVSHVCWRCRDEAGTGSQTFNKEWTWNETGTASASAYKKTKTKNNQCRSREQSWGTDKYRGGNNRWWVSPGESNIADAPEKGRQVWVMDDLSAWCRTAIHFRCRQRWSPLFAFLGNYAVIWFLMCYLLHYIITPGNLKFYYIQYYRQELLDTRATSTHQHYDQE